MRGRGKSKDRKGGKLRLGCKTNNFLKSKEKKRLKRKPNISAVGKYLYLQRKSVVVYKSSSIQTFTLCCLYEKSYSAKLIASSLGAKCGTTYIKNKCFRFYKVI